MVLRVQVQHTISLSPNIPAQRPSAAVFLLWVEKEGLSKVSIYHSNHSMAVWIDSHGGMDCGGHKHYSDVSPESKDNWATTMRPLLWRSNVLGHLGLSACEGGGGGDDNGTLGLE